MRGFPGSGRDPGRVVGEHRPCAGWDLSAWPDVPTRVLVGEEEQLFPVEFQRRLAADRLGLEVETLPGGHMLTLSRPRELVDALLA